MDHNNGNDIEVSKDTNPSGSNYFKKRARTALSSTAPASTDVANANKIVAPGILLFIDQILVAAGGWIFWLVISRITTPAEIGISTAFYSLAMLVTLASQLGLEYPLLKKSSIDKSKILGTVITVELILTGLSVPILLYVAGVMYGEQSTFEYVWLTAGILVLSSLGFVSRFALLGIADARSVFAFDMAGTGVKFALGYLLVSQGLGATGILASFLAYSAVIMVGTLAIGKRRLSFGLGSMTYAKGIIKDGLANMPSKLSKMFIMNLSVVLLALIGAISSSDVGIFYIELMISLAAGSMAASMAFMIIPESASSKTKSGAADGGIRIALGVTAFIVVALLAAPQFVLSLVGPNYATETTSFFILCLSIIPAAILNIAVAKLNTSNKLKQILIVGIVQIATFLSTFLILTPAYGLTGAAVSILIGFAASAILSLGWSHERSFLRAILLSSVAILIGWMAGYSLQILAGPQSPIMLISVSAAATIAVLFSTKAVSISDLRTIMMAAGLGSKNLVSSREGEILNSVRGLREQNIHFLLLGNYGNFNIGDEMLLKAVIKDIRTIHGDKNVVFQIPTRHPEFIEVYHKADSHLILPLTLSSPSKLMRAFRNSDVIIVGGGGIWSRFTGPLAHFIPIVTIAGKLLGKRVEYRAIGLYSTAKTIDRILVNLALLSADSCSVRDDESFRLLWKMNKKKAKKVDDLAIQYLQALSREALDSVEISTDTGALLSHLKGNDGLVVGISAKPVHNQEVNLKLVSEFAAAISALNAQYAGTIHFVFFPFAKTKSKIESDDAMAQVIRGQLSKADNDNITVLEHTDPLSWFIAMRDYVDIFVGMRFHSIIFASEANKPILCIPYERKISEFLRVRHADPNLSVMQLENLDSSRIVEFVNDQVNKKLNQSWGQHGRRY